MKNNKRISGLAVEGNGGGDLLDISCRHKDEDLITVSVSHCCVNTLQVVLPVEVITAVLTRWVENSNGDIEKAIESVWGGNPEHTKVLIERYRKANL